MIHDNLYQYQPMMSPVAVDIDKSDLFGLLLLFSSWNWSVQKYKKHWWTHISIEQLSVLHS